MPATDLPTVRSAAAVLAAEAAEFQAQTDAQAARAYVTTALTGLTATNSSSAEVAAEAAEAAQVEAAAALATCRVHHTAAQAATTAQEAEEAATAAEAALAACQEHAAAAQAARDSSLGVEEEALAEARQDTQNAATAARTYSDDAQAHADAASDYASEVENLRGPTSALSLQAANEQLGAQAGADAAAAAATAAEAASTSAQTELYSVEAAVYADRAGLQEAEAERAAARAEWEKNQGKELPAIAAAAQDADAAVLAAQTAVAQASADALTTQGYADTAAASGAGHYAAAAAALATTAQQAASAAAQHLTYAEGRRDAALAATTAYLALEGDLSRQAIERETLMDAVAEADRGYDAAGLPTGRWGAEVAAARAAAAKASAASAEGAEAAAIVMAGQQAGAAVDAAQTARDKASAHALAARAYADDPAVAASQYATAAQGAASAAEAAVIEADGEVVAAQAQRAVALAATVWQEGAHPAALAAEAAAANAEAAAAAAAVAEAAAAEAAANAGARPTVAITSKDGAEVRNATTLYFDVTPPNSTFSLEDVAVTGGIPGNMYSTHVQGTGTTRFRCTVTMTHANCVVSVPENGFRATGDLQDNNLSSGTLSLTALSIDADAVAAATMAASVVITATAGHDPYVRSANGKITKIPDKHGYYRMFEHDDMFVNVEVDQLDIKEALGAFYKENGFDTALLGGRKPITEGYWNKSLFIESEGHVLEYDIFGETLAIRRDTNYFQVKLVNTESRRRMREMCVDDVVRKTALISWSHTKHGRQELTLDWYANPQVQNGITLTSRVSRSKDSIGLFVKNYEAEYMEVGTLDTGKCVRLHRAMRAAVRAGKSLTHERPIKAHGEEWCFPGGDRLLRN